MQSSTSGAVRLGRWIGALDLGAAAASGPSARALARRSWNQDLEILYVAQNSATAPRGAPSGKFAIFNLMSIRTDLSTIAQSWADSQEMIEMYRDRNVR